MKYFLLFIFFTVGCAFNAHAQSNERIAFGGKLICQLDDQGGVDCATNNGFRRLQPPADTPVLTSIVAGDVHVCGLTELGGAFCWGDNNFGQLNAPQDVQFIALNSGTNLTCGITTDNSAVCWGLDTHGETEPPAGKRFTQTAHDERTSCGLELDGSVSCWGQFSDRANRLAEFKFSKIGINGFDRLCGVTDQNNVRCHVPSLDILGDMIDVAQSNNLTCGLSSTGDISCLSNFIFPPWENHLAQRITEINNGPNVIAIYGDIGSNSSDVNRLCAELDTGEFDCIVRENAQPPVFPGQQLEFASLFPENLSAFVYSDSTIELVWDTRFNFAGADIYRNGELIATTQNGSSYIDDTLVPGVEYQYAVAAFDADGVRSAQSSAVNVTTGQTSGSMSTGGYRPVSRPFEPTGLIVINYNQNEIELFWDRVSSITNNFSGYEIWRDHEFIAFTRGVSFYDNTVQPNTSYDYDVVAVSEDGTILGFNGVEVNTSN